MDIEIQTNAEPEVREDTALPVGKEQIKKFIRALQSYKAGKSHTDSRIVASEQWWKLRNTEMEQSRGGQVGKDGGFTSQSAWLHNVIVSKHADAMESYPSPVILPREAGDQEEAQRLTDIIPCILERNGFEEVYSDAMWQKAKTGTGVYKVVWDKELLNGVGDISVIQVNLLNLYWEPGKKDIQDSRYFFQTDLEDKEVLLEQYPQLEGRINGRGFFSTKFLYDDAVDTSNKHTVIDVYYHKQVGGVRTLQYCKFVGDQVIYASENDPKYAKRGFYDHGLYPFVFDPLFPIEGSPCGYGYVDVCRNPQMAIDTLKTAYIKNAMVGATPRYFARGDGSVNEEEFLDLSKPLVHTKNLTEDALRRIEHTSLDGSYMNVLEGAIQELRETSGNTETSTGNISSGVTAASAIAALQEASGKGSRDSSRASYRVYRKMINLVIELIRQFYDLPRQFRILGENGVRRYIDYSNAGLKPQSQGVDFGTNMGYRLPVFDIEVNAQKQNAYTTVAQNELAIQLYQLGIFNPQMTDQALMCLGMMDFRGREELMQKVAKNGTLMQKLIQYMQMALVMAQVVRPDMVQSIAQDLALVAGSVVQSGGVAASMFQGDNIGGLSAAEPTHVENARAKSNSASQPDSGKVIAGGNTDD